MRTSAPGLPEAVAALTEARLWSRFEGGETTGSTNDDCRVLAAEGVPEGAVVLALEQTRGRGRLGRTWESPRGGIYLSMLLRPAIAPADAGPLPLVVGLGVAWGLESLGAAVALKWPNDVVAAGGEAGARGARETGAPTATGGKLAGLLLESGVEGGALAWVVAGCGLDVRRPDGGGAAGAAYLDELLAAPVSPERAAAALLNGIAEAYSRFMAHGFVPMLEEYARRSALAGRAVRVSDASGEFIAEGTVAGVDASGRLVLDTGGGDVAISAGDVTLRMPE